MLRTDSAISYWIARARAVSIEDAAAYVGAKLKRKGADHAGPCPFGCATADGFVITPKDNVFICRPSGDGGDAIALVMHATGGDFLTACETLTGEARPNGVKEETTEERQKREAKTRERAAEADRRSQAQEREEQTAQTRQKRRIAEILGLMVPLTDSAHGEAYFRVRGITLGSWCSRLGFLPSAAYRDDEGKVIAELPTIVAPIVFAPTGEVIGLHRTYLDPKLPIKFKAPNGGGSKKIYGRAEGGIIPLGEIGATLATGEGIETTAAWAQHPDLGGERDDVSIAAAISLGNMSGGCEGTFPHPTLLNDRGNPVPVPNGKPNPDKPGMILPPQVKTLILLMDGDSEPLATKGRLLAAARRHRARGLEVHVHQAPSGHDFASIGFAA